MKKFDHKSDNSIISCGIEAQDLQNYIMEYAKLSKMKKTHSEIVQLFEIMAKKNPAFLRVLTYHAIEDTNKRLSQLVDKVGDKVYGSRDKEEGKVLQIKKDN